MTSPKSRPPQDIAAQILDHSMGVRWEEIKGSTSLLHTTPRPLFQVVKSYELVPYGRLNPGNKDEPLLPRTYWWDLKTHINGCSTLDDAMRPVTEQHDELSGLVNIVAYEKYLAALEDIRKGTIGASQKEMIRQSPKILDHFMARHNDYITQQNEMLDIYRSELKSEKPTDPLDRVKTEERIFHAEQEISASRIALETMDIIEKLHEELATALGISLDRSSRGPATGRAAS